MPIGGECGQCEMCDDGAAGGDDERRERHSPDGWELPLMVWFVPGQGIIAPLPQIVGQPAGAAQMAMGFYGFVKREGRLAVLVCHV